MTALQHIHRRKRGLNHEPYPATTKWKRLLDKIVYVIGVMGPILTIPQIVKIFINKDVSDISIISWVSYFFGAVILLFYGIVHKEKPLIIMYSCWIVVHLIIIIEILVYGVFR